MDIENELVIEENAVLRYYGDEERIDIPEGIKSIEPYAFENCKTLKSVTIPKSVVQIGSRAFANCRNLECVTIAEGVVFIEDHAFAWCHSLKEIAIPESVLSIGELSFNACEKLENISIGENSLSYAAVDGVLFSKDKTELLLYPAGKKDKSYTIPDGVEVIKEFAFPLNETIEFINLSQSVKNIELGAFSGCLNLRKINLPDSLTEIGTQAFFFCKSLESISIPETVKVIEKGAFEYCRSLKTVNIPKSVTKLGPRSFAGNENMKDIYFFNKYCYIPNEMEFNNKIKIHGFKDSTAEIYAKKNNLQFEEIN